MSYSACDFADDVTNAFVENGLIAESDVDEDGCAVVAGLVIGNTRKLLDDRADLLAALATMTGIAEADCLDDKSNVWRSAIISANAAIARAEGKS